MSKTASPDEIDIAALWDAVRARRVPLALGVIGAGVLTYAALSFMTPRYTSQAQILIENQETVFTRPSTQTQPEQFQRADKESILSQVQVLRSRDLSMDVIRKLRLLRNPEFNSAIRNPGFFGNIASLAGLGSSAMLEDERVLNAFQKRLTVYPVKDSRVISITMTSRDRQLAADAANALTESYISWQQGRETSRMRGASEYLGKQLDKLRAELESADRKLEAFRARTGLQAGQNNIALNAQQLSELNTQLSFAKAQRNEAEAKSHQIRTMLAGGNVNAAPDVLRSQLIQRLSEQRAVVSRQRAVLSATLLPGHPRMRQLSAEAGGIATQIRREVRKVVSALENEAKIAGARERALRANLDETRRQAALSGENQVTLRLLEREAQAKRRFFEATVVRFDEANTRGGSSSVAAPARIVETARLSSIPSFPRKGPMSIFAMAATLLLGLGWIVMRALMSLARGGRETYSARDMAAPAGYAATGDVAGMKTLYAGANGRAATTIDNELAVDRLDRLVNTGRPKANALDQVADSLVTKAGGDPGFRTIFGADGVEGDALAAGERVARRLARGGQKTLLVSLDAAAGSASEAAGSLTDVFRGAKAFRDVVHRDKGSGLETVYACTGPLKSNNPSVAAASHALFERLDLTYDHIIVAGETARAAAAFRLLEGRFDQGIVVLSQDGDEHHAEDQDMFLGYRLPDFDIIRVVVGASARRVERTAHVEQRAVAG